MISNNTHSTLVLEDGAQLAYEVLGSHHIESQEPIVLIGGMSSLRGDWERLAASLAVKRPVLLFDHRGMGDSTLSPGKEEVITMESLARDLLFLLCTLGWRRLSLCGFSMGGVVTQQLLFLPYLSSNPTQLPFHVTHVLLTGTLCSVLRDPRFGLRVDTSVPDRPRTYEEKKEIARPTLEATFDPRWMADTTNTQRFDWWLNRMISGRPTHVILMQGRALNRFTFDGFHDKLPKDMQFLIIHGKEDKIVPSYCGEEILQRIPWAKTVKVGQSPGEIPSLDFGHIWFEYFDIQVWYDVVNEFLKEGEARTPPGGYIARL
ncbi:Alpha/Beta hydrolase protein [Collybia nuda]|uniref:Alpha/Beta hydrolase protein n=1 Tax=Collybia nuda TaxID=64659 RepID=A0A9P5YG29_9AGAR|nr:Alpha/Beta hydrolase protein [Collybia nuda]